jgi:glycosyltransferase involved in cell wall biosynthesis
MQLNIKDDYLLFFGRLEARKNVLRIIEAYERLREKMSRRYQLVLVGSPGFGFDEIKKRVQHSKYQNDIILFGRYLEPENLDPLFDGAKIFISPALCEGFGLTIAEAMANGRPVIASNLSSMPEITDGKALLVDPFNVSEIAQAMFDLLTKKELWENLSREGRKRAEEFDWDKTARETLAVYREAAGL